MRLPVVLLACALSGCTALAPSAPTPTPAAAAPAVPVVASLTPYLEILNEVATADVPREAEMLGELQAQHAGTPGSRATLRYALALGSAGHEASDPVEARRLLQGLLATPGELEPAERQLAAVMFREFDARVTLYAQLGRQREEAEARFAAASDAHSRAVLSASAETARLRRELAQAERKLQAITEMERELLEQVEAAPPEQP